MKECVLNIGDVRAFREEAVTLTCYGLGSCVGVFMQDRTKGITGGAHILLPADETSAKTGMYSNVTQALQAMLAMFKARGSELLALRAKVVGGASVMGISLGIGHRNGRSVMEALVARKVYIVATDLGGGHSRTARFDSTSGMVYVTTPEKKYDKIF